MRHVAEVLVRHGAAALFESTSGRRGESEGAADGRASASTTPAHLRAALEELGTTFVKIGQVLSTRGDLLPPDYQVELAKLQDAATPVAFEEIERALVDEIGSLSERFSRFDREPLAAASIGQAHAATLHDGTDVVVKVRRPGVVEQVERDLDLLRNLAASAAQRSELARRYDVPGLVDELGDTLRSEMDYLAEGRNAERLGAALADDPSVHVPKVFWEITTSRVLTLERIHGTKITDAAGLAAQGIDRPALALRASHVVARMIFELGFYHADPHPGNFFVEADGRLGLVDFGMVGHVDGPTRDRLVALLVAIASEDEQRLVDAVLDLGVSRGPVDRPRLGADLGRLVSRYAGRPLGDVRIGVLLEEVNGLLRRHRLVLPPRLALLIKTLVMEESLGAALDPGFRFTEILAPYAEEMVAGRSAPGEVLRRAVGATSDAARLGAELPRRVRRILADVERGGLSFGVRPQDFGPVLDRLETLGNRIVLGVIAAAFVIGLAVLVAAWRPAGLEPWLPVAFGLGVTIVVGAALWIAWSMSRRRRRE